MVDRDATCIERTRSFLFYDIDTKMEEYYEWHWILEHERPCFCHWAALSFPTLLYTFLTHMVYYLRLNFTSDLRLIPLQTQNLTKLTFTFVLFTTHPTYRSGAAGSVRSNSSPIPQLHFPTVSPRRPKPRLRQPPLQGSPTLGNEDCSFIL